MPETPDNPRSTSASKPRPPARTAVWLHATLSTVEENLALDEALLELAHEGVSSATYVRTWMPAEPAVVLGSSGRIAQEIDIAACDALGVRVLRRPSGGGTVLLGPGCLAWTVVVPHPEGSPPIDRIHDMMLEPLAAALDRLIHERRGPTAGQVARLGTSDLVILPETPVGGAVAKTVARKVSGNALRVRRHGVLYHGTLLDDFDLGLVPRVLRHPPREPDYRVGRAHGDFLANLRLGRESLDRAIRAAFGAVAERRQWPAERVTRLVRDRYTASGWTHRL